MQNLDFDTFMKFKMFKKFIFVQITALIFSMSCFCLPSVANDYVRGVWVATVDNVDFPSQQNLSEKQLKDEIDQIVKSCKSNKINTVFFQVRPTSDALYKSYVFPWSHVVSGAQGTAPDGNFDPLKYIVSACHSNSIKLHAWINPYRICKVEKLDTLHASNPAKTNPEYTVTCSDGYIYFNPALKDVRDLVKHGVEEILRNYDVDGIHFDDYFYPYDVTDYPDSEDYEKYGKEFDNIGDFRRNNVNILVSEVYDLVHKYDSVFGISPFGIWDNLSQNKYGSKTKGLSSYSDIYADSRFWVKNGLVDYICPQIYWSTSDESAPFETLVKWWDKICSKTDVDLYIGHALYKLDDDYKGFESSDQIKAQVDISKNYSSVKGNVFFNYSSVIKHPDALSKKTVFENTDTPAVTFDELKINSPANNYVTYQSNCSVSGVANTDFPLLMNDKTVPTTQNGYFCEYVSLKNGNNTFTFKNGTKTKSITIIKRSAVSSNNQNVFYVDSAFPVGECIFSPLETITVSIDAASDATVFAKIAEKEVELVKSNISGSRATFSTSLSFPNIIYDSLNYGEISFYAIKDGKRIDFDKKATVTLQNSAQTLYTKNECYIYDSVFGGSMNDNYQLSKGSVVVATSFANEQYKLLSGKWISKNDVSQTPVEPSVDIKRSKYQVITITSEDIFETYCKVNEQGVLLVNLYGTTVPQIKNSKDTLCRYISHDNDSTLAISLPNSKVTGFFANRKNEKEVEIYVYEPTGKLSGKKIVIDVGHGGIDCGALGPVASDGPTEAELNLSMSKIISNKLTSEGAEVILTRTSDKTLLLKDRAALIRSYNPDICISVHHNSVSYEDDFNKASGPLVLYSRDTALALAETVSKSITKGTKLENQGLKKQSLNVCREYRFPCILIECGYICNPSEYELILTEKFKNQLAQNIVSSIFDYFSKNS